MGDLDGVIEWSSIYHNSTIRDCFDLEWHIQCDMYGRGASLYLCINDTLVDTLYVQCQFVVAYLHTVQRGGCVWVERNGTCIVDSNGTGFTALRPGRHTDAKREGLRGRYRVLELRAERIKCISGHLDMVEFYNNIGITI